MQNSKEFLIRLNSVRDVEDFVSMATAKPYPIFLDDSRHRVNGKSFMELFCLMLTHPLRVITVCTEEEMAAFRLQASRFLTE